MWSTPGKKMAWIV